MKQLGATDSLDGSEMKNLIATAAVLVSYIAAQLLDLLLLMLTRKSQLLYWFAYFWPYLTSCLHFFKVFCFVRFIKIRIEILNAKLAEIEMIEKLRNKMKQP